MKRFGLERLALASATAIFVAAVVINVLCLVATWHPMPFWDHWDTVADYQHYVAEGLDWERVVELHNEHRLVLSNLLNLVDYRLFRGLGLFLIAVNVALSCAAAYLLCRCSGTTRLHPTSAWVLLSCLAMGTSVTQIGSLAWPSQTALFIVLVLAILSFRAYQRVVAGHGEGSVNMGWLLAAWGLAALASFSYGNGPMAWVVLLLMGHIMRYPWRVRLATLAVGACVIALYFVGYHRPEHHPPLTLALRDPWGVLTYVALYATNAVQKVGHPLQLLLGTALAAYLGGELVRAVTSREAPERDRVLPLGVAAFLLGTIAITAIGRLAIQGPSQANSTRYTTYGLFLLLSAVLLLMWRVERPEIRRAMLPASLGTLVLLCTWSGVLGPPLSEARVFKRARLQVMLCDQARVCPEDVLRRVYPIPEVLHDRIEFLRREGLAQFAPAVAAPPPRGALDVALDVASLPDCLGRVDRVERLPGGGHQIAGWTLRPVGIPDRPDAVSIYSRTGQRLGGGGVCDRHTDIPEAFRRLLPAAFRGYRYGAWATELSVPFYVVGFFGDGSRCKTASLATP